MTAPFDPRYLVPLNLLPPVSGAPTAYLCTECGAAWTGEPTCSNYNPDTATVVECLDLSAPPGDPPTRLDALGWALAVLAKRIGYRIDTIDELRPMIWGGSTTWAFDVFGVGYVAVLRPEDPGWEDYDHADPNRPRRIVAAVLRNHKEPTP